MKSCIRQIMVAALALVLASPLAAMADSIEFGHYKGGFDAKVDGGAFNGNAFFQGTPYNDSQKGNQLGQWQGAGWLATSWQAITTPGMEDHYLWMNNFNLYEVLFGDSGRFELETTTYNVNNPANPIEIFVKDGEPLSAWSMLEDPLASTMTRGVLDLATISFDLVDAPGSNQNTVMVLNGVVNWDSGTTSDFNWTFVDHAQGHGQTLLTVLNNDQYWNHGKGGLAPQVTLETEGGSFGGGGGGEVPEPGTVVLLGSALFMGWRLRRRANAA